jgi:hypothetical protein
VVFDYCKIKRLKSSRNNKSVSSHYIYQPHLTTVDLLSIYLWLYSLFWDLVCFFSFIIYTQSVGLRRRGISLSQGRYLHTQQQKHRLNTHRHPCLEWDSNPRTQRFERAKTVHVLDRAATVIGVVLLHSNLFFEDKNTPVSTELVNYSVD